MCRYQAASVACSVAARRAEYTAKGASKLASGIEDTNSQVIREATELVDEWVEIREGLEVAEEVCTLVASNPEAFEAFCRSVGVLPKPTTQRILRAAVPTRAVGGAIVDAIRAVRGR